MLGKLLKYEFKATARIFLPLYGALFLFALINRLFQTISNSFGNLANLLQFPAQLMILIYVCVIIAVFVMSFVIMIQRFYKNLLGDEGYLMFTLPTTVSSHIFSKLIVAMIWSVVSVIMTIFSLLVMMAEWDQLTQIPQIVSHLSTKIQELLQISPWLFVVELLALGLIALLSEIVHIYASIALGHLFNSHRGVASFGGYIALNFAMQLVTTPVMLLLNKYFLAQAAFGEVLQIAMIVSAIGSLVFGVVFYLITYYIAKKRLNLE